MKKKLALFFIALMMISTVALADGEHTTIQYYTPAATAGTYKNDTVHSLSYGTNLSHVCGGDVGVWFYHNGSVMGLSPSFYRDNNRTAYVSLYENDNSSSAKARTYIRYFETLSNGVYAPYNTGVTYTNSAQIESDGTCELYVSFYVATDSRDTSTAVTSNLMCYRFWSY